MRKPIPTGGKRSVAATTRVAATTAILSFGERAQIVDTKTDARHNATQAPGPRDAQLLSLVRVRTLKALLLYKRQLIRYSLALA